MIALSWQDAVGLRKASASSANWLAEVQLWRPAQHDKIVTADVETAAVILSGTFDLVAGEPGGNRNQWPARGARTTPFQGRPMAVFLPPNTEFAAFGGDGEILLVSARQPVRQASEGREALSEKPLLPLAGSGKAFDPKTGEWMPEETFPSSAESLPPRRMQRLVAGETAVERVIAPDYKAATLTVDEIVLKPGGVIRVQEITGRPKHSELVVFVRSPGGVELQCGDQHVSATGDGAYLVPTPDGETDLVVSVPESGSESAYVLIAYAGK